MLTSLIVKYVFLPTSVLHKNPTVTSSLHCVCLLFGEPLMQGVQILSMQEEKAIDVRGNVRGTLLSHMVKSPFSASHLKESQGEFSERCYLISCQTLYPFIRAESLSIKAWTALLVVRLR